MKISGEDIASLANRNAEFEPIAEGGHGFVCDIVRGEPLGYEGGGFCGGFDEGSDLK